jgi:transcriptional regulator with XRE-family HTH domain
LNHVFKYAVNDRQILRSIGKNVQRTRLQAGLTQECLAELIEVHWKTLSGIERGLFPFAVTSFARIAKHLGVTADSLLEGVEPPDPKRAAAVRKAMARKRRPKHSSVEAI